MKDIEPRVYTFDEKCYLLIFTVCRNFLPSSTLYLKEWLNPWVLIMICFGDLM